ncbi:MAG: hypothetical protein OT477_10730 [Chloroflexi bacterium]|nr:hypothetical protein [Chloroflexota bacterium]
MDTLTTHILGGKPLSLYEQLIPERETHFQVLDRIQQHLPDVPEEEVVEDVAEAIAAVRRQTKQG